MTPLRIAVVGAGSIARRYHLPALRTLAAENHNLRLAAICDLDASRAEEACRAFGFGSWYTDYRRMAEAEAPSAVLALVPYTEMLKVAGFFLDQRIPILMEKPPGRDPAEVRSLLELVERRGTPHQVAFNRRYAPFIVSMGKLAEQAGGATATACQFLRYNRAERDFAFATGLHGFDTLRFLGPGEVRSVATVLGSRGSALVTYEYENGSFGVMEMSPRVGVQSERYTVHAGSRTLVVDGVVEWLNTWPGFLECYDEGKRTIALESEADARPELAGGFYGEDAAFVEAISMGRSPAPDLREAFRSVEIAEAVRLGRSISFGYHRGSTRRYVRPEW